MSNSKRDRNPPAYYLSKPERWQRRKDKRASRKRRRSRDSHQNPNHH